MKGRKSVNGGNHLAYTGVRRKNCGELHQPESTVAEKNATVIIRPAGTGVLVHTKTKSIWPHDETRP